MGRPKKPKIEKGEKEVDRADRATYNMRVRQVIDWMLSDQLNSDMVSTGMSKWGLSDRQMQRYIKAANEVLAEINKEDIQQSIAWHLQRSKRALRQLDEKYKSTPSGVFAIKAILEHMAKIGGVYTQRVDVTSKGDKVSSDAPVRFMTYSESLKENYD